MDDCDTLTIRKSRLTAGNGGDNYVIRCQTDNFLSSNTEYVNPGGGSKATLRIWRCDNFLSEQDVIRGGRIMLGGGAGDERLNPQPFNGLATSSTRRGFYSTRIDVASIEVYPRSQVTFTDVDFAGSGNIVAWDGSTVHLVNCRNVPIVKWNKWVIVNGQPTTTPTGTTVIVNGVVQQ